MTTTEERQTTGHYLPAEVENKWQERWAQSGIHTVRNDDPRPNWYELTMYPYPSGDLHIGHWYAMAPSDAHARFRRMQGFNVLHPMGFDAFGLPAENAAIKDGVHPHVRTMDNIENMRRQLRSMGTIYDWDREVVTCLPDYYKWNQWLFIQFYNAGLAYRAYAPANWCPKDNTVLANEQVENGRCERCGSEVVRRDIYQWLFRVTDYADELLEQSKIEWPEKINTMQTNWIGRSEGVDIDFDISEYGLEEKRITTFTTRIDTIFGVTFGVLAPEHPLVQKLTTPEHRAQVEAYVEQARRQTEIERLSTEKEKTGVRTGSYATNLLNGERVPILVGDYVLMSYGTGIVMGVPAHDQRDFEFATEYGLPIKVVVAPPDYVGSPLTEAYIDEGTQSNSGQFDGMPSAEGWQAMADHIEDQGWGKRAVRYRMRDWLISRQRYWGTPIPIVYCDDCGTVPVAEADLPVLLPEDAEFRPTGESPLGLHEGFLNTTCPNCDGPAVRETDTMDTFVDSSWYQFRFPSPDYDDAPFDPSVIGQWAPVDQYTGGAEHAVMHLLYARFFTKAMRDLGLLDFDEPFVRLYYQGHLLAADGQKMSKSPGQRGRPGRIRRGLRGRRGAVLPDVHWPVGPRRELAGHRHQRRVALAQPRLGDCAEGLAHTGRLAYRSSRQRRLDPSNSQDNQARREGCRGVQVQHGAGRSDGVLQLAELGVGGQGRRFRHVERRRREALGAAGPHGPAHYRGAVGARRPHHEHPQRAAAGVRCGPGRRRDDRTGRSSQRQGARHDRHDRRRYRGRRERCRDGFGERPTSHRGQAGGQDHLRTWQAGKPGREVRAIRRRGHGRTQGAPEQMRA